MTVVVLKVAAVFRAFARNESPSAKEAERAVHWLMRRKGLGFPSTIEERYAIYFISDCYAWLRDQCDFFTTSTDIAVLAAVSERFREYMKARSEAANPRRDQPWRPGSLPEYSDGRVREKSMARMNWDELKKPSRQEKAAAVRATKATDFAQFLQRLKERGDKEAKLYLSLIELTLRENAKCSRRDLALDAALRERAMQRTPRIRTLAYRRSRSK